MLCGCEGAPLLETRAREVQARVRETGARESPLLGARVGLERVRESPLREECERWAEVCPCV